MVEITVIVAVLGLLVGSFLNAWVWRLHEGRRVSSGRSMCPGCEHALRFWDLLPVASWLWLRGRCRYCKGRISWQYPVVEIVTATAFALNVIWWPFPVMELLGGLLLSVWLVVTALFIGLSVYDLRWYELPAPMLRSLLGVAVLWQLLHGLYGATVWEWLWSPLLGALAAFGFFYALHVAGKGKWMGGGDVKLVFVLGLLTGLQGALVGLFLAFVSGAVIGIILLTLQRKGRRDMVPFGPFLMIGFWVSFFWAEELTAWYTNLLVLT